MTFEATVVKSKETQQSVVKEAGKLGFMTKQTILDNLLLSRLLKNEYFLFFLLTKSLKNPPFYPHFSETPIQSLPLLTPRVRSLKGFSATLLLGTSYRVLRADR